MMHAFGRYFKEYREEYLNIRQIEAAQRLGITTESLSNYEREYRQFPMELLRRTQDVFDIPDDYFLAMIREEPLKYVRSPHHAPATKEIQAQYVTNFIESYADLLQESDEMRELIVAMSQLTTRQRRDFLNALKKLIDVLYVQLDRSDS